MASGEKFYIADKGTLDEVDEKIGSAADTGGSSTAGSVFGKINYLVSQVSSYLSNIYTYVSKIGATNDSQGTATTGTVMGKLNYLIAQVNSYLSNIYSYIVTARNRIGDVSDTGGTIVAGTVMAKENAILTEVNKIGNTTDTGATETAGTVMGKLNKLTSRGCIKSVQRGDMTSSNGYIVENFITINTVNPTKCLIILNHSPIGTASGHGVSLKELTANSLSIYVSGSGARVSWQVIEFY